MEFDADKKRTAEGMALCGVPYEDISRILGVSVKTLKKYLGETLDEAKRQRIANVGQNLYRIAMGDDKAAVTAAIFIMKTQAGWKETSAVEMSGPDGAPIDNVLRVEFVEPK